MGRLLSAALLAPAAFVVACGDDSPPPPPPPTDATTGRDTGPSDSGLDGATPTDGRVPPLFDAGPSSCRATGAFALMSDPEARNVNFDLGAGPDGFLVGWSQRRETREDVYLRHVPTDADPGAEINLTDDAFIAHAPGITAADTGWLLAWADQSPLNFELFTATAGPGAASIGAENRITDNALLDDLPVLVPVSAGTLALWTQQAPAADPVAVRTVLDAAGVATSPPAPISAMESVGGRIRAGSLGDGVAAVWLDNDGTDQTIALLALDESGVPMGASQAISSGTNAGGGFDYAGSSIGGGVVFDTNPGGRGEVHFRPVDTNGAPSGPEVVLAPGLDSRSPSIAAFGGGFIIAYRARIATGWAVRLAIADLGGTVQTTTNVAPVADVNGQNLVRVAADGTALIVYSQAGEGVTIDAARLECGG